MIDHGVLTDIIGGTVLQALNDAGYEIVRIGQPRQADPSGAASSSTTSEQPADPAAPPAYCSATSGRLACCCLPDHDGPHESFGGVQW